MKLSVTIEGTGPDLVLLHGWGLNSRIWDAVAQRLKLTHRVHRIDLPGHGSSEWRGELRHLDDWVRSVAPYVPRDAVVAGWSLGGLLALRLALLSPERIARLVLISTTPRFVTAADWTCAMTATVLANFAQQLRSDFRGTVQDFLALQVRGEERELASLRELRQRLQAGGLPQAAALEAGLEILRVTDLRSILASLSQPALVVAGEHDRVTPPDASRFLAERLRAGQILTIRRAGHAPFISHIGEFLLRLEAFLATDSAAASAGAGA